MIYLIYATITIEIILAVLAIIGIVKFNNKINLINDTMLENRYKITQFAENLQTQVYETCEALKICGKKIVDKKRTMVHNLIKNLILSIGLMFLSKKYKKQVLYIELALIAYETYKNSLKV